MYQDWLKNAKGMPNYQMVFERYRNLFESLDVFSKNKYGVIFILPTQEGLDIFWQEHPEKVEVAMLSYAASLYYQIHFDRLKPEIRLWMANWYFVERHNRYESDYQDELVLREINRYHQLLQTFMRYRKSRLAQEVLLQSNPLRLVEKKRNEIVNSQEESMT